MSAITLDPPARPAPIRHLTYAPALGLLVGATVTLPTKPVLVAFGALILASILIRARHDAALLVLVLVGAVALPATLTVPALGSLGAPTILIGLAALGVWLIDWLAPRELTRAGVRPIPLLVVAFVGAHLASYAAAGLRPLDYVELVAADRGVITVLASAGIVLLAAEAVSSRDRLDAVVKGVVVAGSVIAVVGVIQFTTGFDLASRISIPALQNNVDAASFIAERSIFRRVAGTTLHAIEFSVVLCIVLPLALHLAIHHSRRWFMAVALLGVALPMSVSRTAVLGMAALVIVIVPGWPRALRRRFYAGAAVYLVAVRLLIPGLLGTIRALFADAATDPSIQSRQTDYEFITLFIDERPLFGRGFSTFIPTRYDFIDNQYLMSLVETGYVGVGAYIALLGGAMMVARSIRRRAANAVDRDLAQALVASLAVVAGTSFAFDFLSFPSARTLLFVVVGCVGALWRMAPVAGPSRETSAEAPPAQALDALIDEAPAGAEAGARPPISERIFA